MSPTSKSDEAMILAKELLEDVELSRTTIESLVFKARRLARIVNSEEHMQWLHCESTGYNATHPTSVKYMGWTARWIDFGQKTGYWGSAAQQQAAIEREQIQLEVVARPLPAIENAFIGFQIVQQRQQASVHAKEIERLKWILSRVRSLIQHFAAGVYYEKMLSGQAETIFETYKREVDGLLAARAGDALSKIPHIFERLSNPDPEAISQGLLTCRRVIDSFADAVYPPRNEQVMLGSKPTDVGPNHVKNRLRAYVTDRVASTSRRERIFRTLLSLYDRVSAGVHSDVEASEARAVVLQTYLLLGEILSLGNVPDAPPPNQKTEKPAG